MEDDELLYLIPFLKELSEVRKKIRLMFINLYILSFLMLEM